MYFLEVWTNITIQRFISFLFVKISFYSSSVFFFCVGITNPNPERIANTAGVNNSISEVPVFGNSCFETVVVVGWPVSSLDLSGTVVFSGVEGCSWFLEFSTSDGAVYNFL